MDWFLYDKGLRHERVKLMTCQATFHLIQNFAEVFFVFRGSLLTRFKQ